MKIIHLAHHIRTHLGEVAAAGKTIGFVPTMGALHQGHISLVKQSLADGCYTVCSIFINPRQFTNADDLEKYPRTTEQDLMLLENAGCDLVFMPSVEEVFPAGYEPPDYHLGYLDKILEGAFRPGHFHGVCQVVDRLLQMVEPHKMYIGQKDFQQCMVLKKLMELTGRKTEVCILPTMREDDGLAMSSRNLRLTPEQRAKAPALFKALQMVAEGVHLTLPEAEKRAEEFLVSLGFEVDYLVTADRATLEVLENWQQKPMVILTAAFLDDVRLIDNLLLD